MVSFKSLGRLFGLGDNHPLGGERAGLALDLHRKLRRTGENLAFSPDSVRLCLSMALAGARGETRGEIASALRTPEPGIDAAQEAEKARLEALRAPGQAVTLTVANGLFAARDVPIDEACRALLQTRYLAAVEGLDFAGDPEGARARIDAWVSDATKALIPEMVGKGGLREGTRLILANALYFKGQWARKFLASTTIDLPFFLAPGHSVPVPTMSQTTEYKVYVGADAEALEMPYVGGELAMTLLLPPSGATLDAFEERVTADALEGWLSKLEEEKVQITLPRFEIDGGGLSLMGPLAEIGVTRLFDPSACDLSGLTRERLALSDILHRTRLKVTEEGTEAAAATLAFASQSMARKRPRTFAFNRPFLFLLRDLRDQRVLFMGRVADPRKR